MYFQHRLIYAVVFFSVS